MSNMTPEELHPKPTDSEQPSDSFLEMANDAYLTVGQTKRVLAWHKQENQERDQQRLSTALEALPKQMFSDEDPNNPYHGNNATAYSNGRNTTIIESRQALTAALGPDNSKIEE